MSSISIHYNPKSGATIFASNTEGGVNVSGDNNESTTINNLSLVRMMQEPSLANICGSHDSSHDNSAAPYKFPDNYIIARGVENYPDVIFSGELMCSNTPQHILYGTLESVSLREESISQLDCAGQQLNNLKLKVSGLNITSDFDASKTIAENQQGEVHNIIDSLVQSNPAPLLEKFQAKGIDINIPLKDMAIANQFETTSEVTDNISIADVVISIVDVVGVIDVSDVLLAA
ncbi:heme acquisition protein HasA [Yersinia bercovieri]|uniref:heme acquisition protein HasA n=1 Tax=Yersinia bercovieri TaxID=634 RepID=UPI0011A40E02|nr:heme acquisition protein HasA [Yersinia bercovieri]